MVNNLPANAGDARAAGSIPGLGRCPGEGNGIPLQYSCLENPRGESQTEESGGLQSVGSQRVRHDWVTGHAHTHTRRETRAKHGSKLTQDNSGNYCKVRLRNQSWWLPGQCSSWWLKIGTKEHHRISSACSWHSLDALMHSSFHVILLLTPAFSPSCEMYVHIRSI